MSQQEHQRPEGSASLRESLSILRLRKWSIAIVTLVVVGAALAFSLRQTPLYESTSRVLVKPIAFGRGGGPPTVNLETERGLVASAPVAERVAENLEIAESPPELLGDLEVEVVAGSEFLLMRYRDPDPVEARRRAQGFAQEYLDYRRDQVVNDILDASEAVQKRVTIVSQELQETQAAFRGATISEKQQLQGRINLLNGQLAVLEQQLLELTPGNISVGQVVEPAQVPSEPASPNFIINLGLALVLGLALGIALAYLRERLDDRLRGRADLETQAGAPVLAVIPKIGSWKRKKETPTIALAEPKSAPSEAFRTLRTGLTFLGAQEGVKTILVTSAHPDEGKTSTTANLAVTLAQAGKRVVAISADLRKPRLHRFFGITQNGMGLTNVIAGEASTFEALTRTGVESLRLLSSGPVPGNPNELLGSDRMGQVIGDLREVSDFVLIDTAPVLAVADALTLAPFADAVLLVADAEKTTRGSVAHTRQQLDQVNANVVGTVLNNFDPNKAKAYPYYYQYYYTYRYEEPATTGGRRRGQGSRGRRLALPAEAAEAADGEWSA